MKWLSAILVILLASGCRCFHVYCDECMSDQFSNSEMVRFRTDSGQFSLEELDTVFVYSIAAGSSDTILKILTDNNFGITSVKAGDLKSHNENVSESDRFIIRTKDFSKSVVISGIRQIVETEDPDACCSCSKRLISSAAFDSALFTANQLPFIISK